jgi:hypothetical protein
MLGGISQRLFGPSRRARRRAAADYFHLYLMAGVEGEYVPNSEVVKGYAQAREKHGWPELDGDTLLRELHILGCEAIPAIKVPWSNGSPPRPALAKPEPIVSTPEATEPSGPEPPKQVVARTVRAKVATGSTSQDEALADVRARLARGETMPSQKFLADAWGMSESRVCEWFRIWRAAGLVPPPKREGICNVIAMPRKAA